MPPQVNPSGCRPTHTQSTAGTEEVKQCEPEPQKDSSAATTTTPHRATPKEASARKAELAAGGFSQQTALNGRLNTGQSTNKKASTTASETYGRLRNSAKQMIPETTAVAPGVLKAAAAGTAIEIKKLQDEIKNFGKDLEKKLVETYADEMEKKIEEKMNNFE
jgi:hypothetical protein